MGRDEHRKKKNNFLSQTPNKTDGIDVEFAMETADNDDLEALKRSQQADKRTKRKQ